MEIQQMSSARYLGTSTRTINRARLFGFSLIELMMTIAVAVILMMIAVPSFQYVTNSNRMSSEINGLLGDLQFARSEAIKEGQYVTVCASSDGASCSDLTAWQNGWIVVPNPSNSPGMTYGVAMTTMLRVQNAFSSTDTLDSNGITSVTFNRDGYAVGMAAGTLLTLHDKTSNKAWTRCAAIAPSGIVTTELYGVGGCT